MDLGLASGDAIWVQSVSLILSADVATVVQIMVADFAVQGTAGSIRGPLSKPILVTPGTRASLSWTNPNPKIIWGIGEQDDDLVIVQSTNEAATVTFSGTVSLHESTGQMRQIS